MRRLNVTHPQISLEDFIYYYHIAHKRKISVRLISSAICILSYPLWRFKTIPCQSGMTHQNTITTAGTRLHWEAPI
mgnify:CR=1 FL=1